MVKVIDGFRSFLKAKLMASSSTISIPRADAIRLNNVGVGNHVYLTIKDRGISEIVRYDHQDNWTTADSAIVQLPVTRNARGLGAKNFPYGACVVSDVNSLYIEDLVRGQTSGFDCVATTNQAIHSEGCGMPTTIVGGRDAVLGNPAGMLEVCENKLIPYYVKEGA